MDFIVSSCNDMISNSCLSKNKILGLGVAVMPNMWSKMRIRIRDGALYCRRVIDPLQKALELPGGGRPVLAATAGGGDSALRLMDMLAPGGTMTTFGAMSKQSIKVPNGFLIFKGVQLKGLWVTQWLKNATRADIEFAYGQLSVWMASGRLKQAVDSVYRIENVNEAAAKAQEEFRNGKIVLRLGE